MVQINVSEQALKQALKDVLVETLQEQRGLLRDVFVDAIEDFAMTEAIREGKESDVADRDEIMTILKKKS